MGNFPTNVFTIRELLMYLLSIYWSIYGFVFQSIADETFCSKDVTYNLRDTFYMKLIAILITQDFVTRSLLRHCFLFCRNQNQESKL